MIWVCLAAGCQPGLCERVELAGGQVRSHHTTPLSPLSSTALCNTPLSSQAGPTSHQHTAFGWDLIVHEYFNASNLYSKSIVLGRIFSLNLSVSVVRIYRLFMLR